MKLRKKASVLALCAILLGTSIAPISAATKDKIAGKDRYETAARIADRMGNYETAILVNSDKSLADGLSASSLAGKENAPILLTSKDNLPAATEKRLEKVKKVYIIGGDLAISKKVESKLAGKEVIRIEGKDRIATSVEVAKRVKGAGTAGFVVNGFTGEADAMSVAAVAARDKAPIILTDGKTMPIDPDVYLYVIGGEKAVSADLELEVDGERIAGEDRYETNAEVIKYFYKKSGTMYFSKGDGLVDALTASSLAKNDGIAFVSKDSDKSILRNRGTLIQVGEMKDEIVNAVFKGENTADKGYIRAERPDLMRLKGSKINYEDFYAHAGDVDGKDISDKIQIVGEYDENKMGTYNVTLVVKLSNGKELKQPVVINIYE